MDNIEKFKNQIMKDYKIDISNNIIIDNNKNKNKFILVNNYNFNFFNIFVEDVWKSGLYKYEKYHPIGTSEDNNIYIPEKYFETLHPFFVSRFTKDYIFLCKQ